MPHIDDGTLHALLDGALRAQEPERAGAVEAHLDACADCRARLEHAAALRDQASDVLAALDFGLSDDAEAPAPVPDFGEVLARTEAAEEEDRRAAGGDHTPSSPGRAGRSPADTARLRRRLGWTRGLAWAATIVVALGTGYIIGDLAGPTGEMPRADTPMAAPAEAAAREPGGAAEEEAAPQPEAQTGRDQGTEPAVAEEALGPAPAPEPEAAGAGGVTAAPSGAEVETAKTLADEAAPPPADQGAGVAPGSAQSVVLRRADGARTEMLQSLSGEALQPTAVSAPTPRSSASSGVLRTRRSADVVGTDVLDANRLVGCYQLELGEWSPPREEGAEPLGTPSIRIELMDSVGAAGFERGNLLLRPRIGGSADGTTLSFPGAFWVPVAPDSVRLVWTNGAAAVALRLGVRGDTLEGRAAITTDELDPGRVGPTAPARAVRAECPRINR